MFHVILFQPEIPPNTGNIIRLCANTGCHLHLIEPLGYELDDKRLRRAGLDYHEYATLERHADLPSCLARIGIDAANADGPRLFAFTTKGSQPFHEVSYRRGDALLFGPESRGLPPEIVDDIKGSLEHPERISYFQQTPQRQPTLRRKFDQLRQSGVVLLVGTDSGIPMKFHSQSTWNELDVWVNQFGVPAIDAIRAATYWPAVAMGVDKDYGTVTEGKYADIVAVHGDALKQVALLQRIDLVVKHGKRVR